MNPYYEEKDILLYYGDCLEIMPTLADKSIDMILCDLPYGTTACKWDTIIPFEPLWAQYKRLIKDNGAIVLTASQPFTSALVMSNPGWFKYEWIWDKTVGANIMQAKYQPMKIHENIVVFCKGKINYHPIKTLKDVKNVRPIMKSGFSNTYNTVVKNDKCDYINKFPESIIRESSRNGECNPLKRLHPTQKPVALFEYLIRTYTNEGDTVLDNCAGSGTTGVACKNLKRKAILIEKEEKYCEIIVDRIKRPGEKIMVKKEVRREQKNLTFGFRKEKI